MMTNKEGKYQCPCCECFTYSEKPINTFQLCEVCFWEDDGIQFDDPLYEDGAQANLEKGGIIRFFDFDANTYKNRYPNIEKLTIENNNIASAE